VIAFVHLFVLTIIKQVLAELMTRQCFTLFIYFVENERWINEILLQQLQGTLSLTDEMLQSVKTLATSCPFIAGNGVYKARELYGQYAPHKGYNDRALCNYQGLFRLGAPKLVDSAQHYLQQLAAAGDPLPVLVYPNPSNGIVKIASLAPAQCTSLHVELFSALGVRLGSYNLDASTTVNSIDISQWPAGTYTLKIICSGLAAKTVKLTKI
jgi:hypothetical protein